MLSSSPTRRFIRHYAEMLLAMLAGMLVFGAPIALLLDIEAPALRLVNMAVTMTVPMVAWMRYRGHAWMPCAEMTAAMVVPTLAVLGLLWTGVTDDLGVLMTIEHATMFPSMLLAMLLRRDEYTGHDHRGAAVTA